MSRSRKIYAVDRDSPHHAPARRWLEEALSGSASVGIPWIAALAFVRITTHPAVMRKPLSAESAIDYVDGWLRLKLIGPGEKGRTRQEALDGRPRVD